MEDILDLLGIDADIIARDPVTPGDGAGMVKAVLDVEGDDLGMLIGRRGETLVSLQYLLNLMVARRTRTRAMVGVDIGGYRRRREDSLRNLANRMAERVRMTGQSVTLEPMPPNERRIVHMTLKSNPEVTTESNGEGANRRVTVQPRV
jgi:spoIIIJ-associated protein